MTARSVRASDRGSQSGAWKRRRRWRAAPRWMQIVNLVVFLSALLTIVVAINFFAGRAPYRVQIDATKTRAYSLSDQTRQLLQGLPAGQWTIAMVMSDASVSRSMRTQIDEVLRRYTDASPNIRVLKINPDDPGTLRQYEQLLRDLQALYKNDITAYDKALDDGVVVFKDLQVFAQQRAGELATLARLLPEQHPARKRLEQSIVALGRFIDQDNRVLDTIRQARRMDETQPIPDYEGARSALALWLTSGANEVDAIAGIFRGLLGEPTTDGGARAFVTNAVQQFDAVAQRLASAADPLKRLPAMDLGAIGQQLAQGEAAVILGPPPHRAAVIPASQLLPKSNFRTTRSGGTLFDQRFRGEHLLSAAIRSLIVQQMPMVVFVHAEGDSLLKIRDNRADLVGVAAMLRTARYDVREWEVSQSATRPKPTTNQRIVWVVVPPPPARSIEPTPAVRSLFNGVAQLISDGENVLLSVYPSLLAKYGQTDPFQFLAQPFGLKPETDRVIFERLAVSQGQSQVNVRFLVRDFLGESPIGRAVDGQQTFLEVPVPIRREAEPTPGVDVQEIASIEASPQRWLEPEWTGDLAEREPRPEHVLADPALVVVSAQRRSPAGIASQRFVLVSAGGWMISNAADAVRDIGGGRVALENPGNHELMLASVAWLAGMDELIAASPMSQEVSRLRGITPEVRAAWWWIIVAGVPLACFLLGGLVWLWRRM